MKFIHENKYLSGRREISYFTGLLHELLGLAVPATIGGGWWYQPQFM
jgi:hypothetical protein